MKKYIVHIVIALLVPLSVTAQTDAKSFDSNHPYLAAFKYLDWGEMGGQLSEFSYGFLNQGVKTVVGTYETLKELPDALKRYDEVDAADFGSFLANSVYEGVSGTIADYVSGEPEKAGAAAFDLVLIVDGGKQAVKSGVKGIQGAQKAINDIKTPKTYHYTDKGGGRGIQEKGLLKPSSRARLEKREYLGKREDDVTFTADDGYLGRKQASEDLALDHEVDTRVTILKDERWEPVDEGPVEPKFGKPGGGYEFVRNVDIPSSAIYDVGRMWSKPIMVLEDYAVTPVKKLVSGSYPILTSAAVSSAISHEILDDSTEGGHSLTGRVGLVIIIEESMERGRFMTVEENDVKYVLINPNDIDQLTPDFVGKMLYSGYSKPMSSRNRNREDVIPADNREGHRGL